MRFVERLQRKLEAFFIFGGLSSLFIRVWHLSAAISSCVVQVEVSLLVMHPKIGSWGEIRSRYSKASFC